MKHIYSSDSRLVTSRWCTPIAFAEARSPPSNSNRSKGFCTTLNTVDLLQAKKCLELVCDAASAAAADLSSV